MKQYGFVGKGTGKLGASVFAISGGEQIVRQYNPVVSNPNTEAQIAQRAKLKLMSQIGAVLAPALGFAKMGLVSARNQFISKNIGLCTFTNNLATCTFADLQLTPSNVAIPQVTASVADTTLSVSLSGAAGDAIKRVAYFVFEQSGDSQLVYRASKIVAEAGEGRNFPTTFTVDGDNLVVYAYGIKDNNANATMRYEDYVAAAGSDTADLAVVALFRSADYGLTKTTGVVVE